MKKIAVILFNLGGPDSKEAIRPFLLNFFMDKNIIRLPYPFRWLLARFIAFKRSWKEAGNGYALLGNKSPLLDNTKAQEKALQDSLNGQETDRSFKVFTCMRYWHPMANDIVQDVKIYNPDHIVMLPLYPQYSTTTTGSSFEDWERAAKKYALKAQFSEIQSYEAHKGFVQASAQNILKTYNELVCEGYEKPRILFSAHGLPESIIKAGDPYQSHCEKSADAIIKALHIEGVDWCLCYQSRVGPQKWIGPDTIDEIKRAGKDHTAVLIYPLAFVSEHIETLVEIEIEYRDLAKESGVPAFKRVETVGTNDLFINGLANLVLDRVHKGEQ